MLLIKNIAVCDLAMGIFGVHPTLVTLVYGSWPYGNLGCKIFYYIDGPVSYVSAVLLVCSLQLNKIYTIVYPLSTVGRSSKLGYTVSVIVWILAALNPLSKLIIDSSDVSFKYRVFKCGYDFTAPIWDRLLLVSATLFTFFPNLVVAVTTVTLVVMVRKIRGRTNTQGIVTALYVGVIYFIANGPLCLYLILYGMINTSHSTSSFQLKHFFLENFFQLVSFLMFLNCFSNSFVYYRSVTSFGLFVRQKILAPLKNYALRFRTCLITLARQYAVMF